MIAYLDVNVVLDYLLGHRRFGLEAAEVITLLRDPNHKMYTAPNAVVMSYAFIRQQNSELTGMDIKHTLALFRRLVDCVTVESRDIDQALTMQQPVDLEDCLQIVLAQKCRASVIVTNDRKGFKGSPIIAKSTAQFLSDWEM